MPIYVKMCRNGLMVRLRIFDGAWVNRKFVLMHFGHNQTKAEKCHFTTASSSTKAVTFLKGYGEPDLSEVKICRYQMPKKEQLQVIWLFPYKSLILLYIKKH